MIDSKQTLFALVQVTLTILGLLLQMVILLKQLKVMLIALLLLKLCLKPKKVMDLI